MGTVFSLSLSGQRVTFPISNSMEEASRMMYDSEKNRRELITIIHKRNEQERFICIRMRCRFEWWSGKRGGLPNRCITREYRDARDKRVFNVEQGGRPVEKAQLDIASARN